MAEARPEAPWQARQVAVDGNEVRFRFAGKSGKQWSLRVRDRRIAKIIKACQELPGQELLQYVDEASNEGDGRHRPDSAPEGIFSIVSGKGPGSVDGVDTSTLKEESQASTIARHHD